MKQRKKAILALVLSLSLAIVSFPLCIYAEGRVCTAVDVIASDVTLVKSAKYGESLSFSEADFKKALGVRSVSYVTVTALPAPESGVLRLASLRVAEGQVIRAENLPLLSFTPANELVESAVFSFTCDDYAAGSELTCSIRFADTLGHAPVVAREDSAFLSVSTQKSIAVFGVMHATDEDGDTLTYEIVSYPKKGVLTVIDRESGEYRYTPLGGYTGRDSFTYVARDEYGNYSKTATVSICVEKPESALVFSDMTDHRAHYAAIVMTQSGVMTGVPEGNGVYFLPEDSVSRAEFTVMAMKAAGLSPLDLDATAFEDNADIARESVAYIATAQARGYVNGILTADGLVFEPNRAVTAAEAAIILHNVFDVSGDGSVMTFAAESAVPVYARPAVSALAAIGVVSLDGYTGTSPISRATAAEMLYKLSIAYGD